MNAFRNFIFSACLLLGFAVNAEPAPDFTLASNKDQNIKLSEQLGNVVMINFWATWCGPCRKEMPELEKLYQRYQDAGFMMLGVNVETDRAAAEQFIAKNPVSFPILFDLESTASKAYDVKAMPTTVLVDRDGNIREVYKGYKAGAEKKYRDDIRALLSEL